MTGPILSPTRGYEITCSVVGCTASTADQAPSRLWRTPEAAVRAALALGWVHYRRQHDEPQIWVCPLQQRWDAKARRWVPDLGREARA